ncbi:GNAT family N-acetyltransferase [Gordonia sp. VNK21]|uniref:GNAT family N-acetyltransferase n=1 Tax=Gordonia sp. VNK21 TaxID=3382483 RepID=UPI0038D3E1E9
MTSQSSPLPDGPAVPPPTVVLDPPPELRANPDRDRYELWSGDELVGVEGYERTADGNLILLHTVVTEKFGRAGFARLLVASVLDDVAAQGRTITPVCTYVQRFLERFPQYQVLVES